MYTPLYERLVATAIDYCLELLIFLMCLAVDIWLSLKPWKGNIDEHEV